MPHESKPVTIGENDNAVVRQIDRLANDYMVEQTCFKEIPDARGQFMLHLIEKFGVVAATTGQEDSAGRATMVLQSETDVVKRAATLTELAFSEMEQRGWLVKLTRPE